MIAEHAVVACERLCLSRIFNGMAHHAHFDEFESTLSAEKFHHPAAFTIPPVRSLHYLPQAFRILQLTLAASQLVTASVHRLKGEPIFDSLRILRWKFLPGSNHNC